MTEFDPAKCRHRIGFDSCDFNHLPEKNSTVYRDSSPLTQEMVNQGRTRGPCDYKGPCCVYK